MASRYYKDPNSLIQYSINWSKQYPTDTLVASAVVLDTTGGVEVQSQSVSGLIVDYLLSGGTNGIPATVTCTAGFESGQIAINTDVFTIEPAI